jgi:tetratricopeptide (TPR) repeat protein
MKSVERFRTLGKTGLALLFLAAPYASAQAAAVPGGSEQPFTTESGEVIVVEAFRRDRALDAFLRGDFETAEAGFRDNWRCIWRNERLFEASLRQAASDSISASMSPGGRMSMQNFIQNMPQRADEIRERTCFNAEWQFYMMGLSQIQLGKFAEAKKSLTRAAEATKDELMFDAHYRLGLLELLDGNIERADRRLARLTKMQRKCNNRGARCEIHADLDVATAYLTRAIATARRQST